MSIIQNTQNPENIELYNQQIREIRPRLVAQINLHQDHLILTQNGRDFVFQIQGQSREMLQKLLCKMDGSLSLSEITEKLSPNTLKFINELVSNLDKQGFIDDLAQVKINSGIDRLLELPDLTNKLLDNNIKQNPLWQAINSTTSKLPINVLYGFAIEHYHLFSHNCYSYSPLLSFQGSTKIRQIIKQIYSQQSGQDELLLTALNTIGINQNHLTETMPLAETTALCNGLAYWANFDPLFLLSIIGTFADQILKNFAAYTHYCEWVEIDSSFLKPIQQLNNAKLNDDLEVFTHRILQEMPPINEETKQRLKSQTYLFGEIYNNFYQAIWNHYANNSNLLRRITTI